MASNLYSFILLMGIWEMVGSFHIPQGFTPAQWFITQHMNMSHPICNNAMQTINRLAGRRCKNQNTFLQTTYQVVSGVCYNPNVRCRSGLNNCHVSSMAVFVNHCNLTRRNPNYRLCTYQQTRALKNYTIACNNRQNADPPQYPVVPVHLDDVF
ncbi:PREDICTED: non-secretory ribonuclease [Elephantulus edwardii]|uniref:non-secretory ribonuclease n=1 Tax=Elephantulus edwardii TaxID=28737 RepID=UPI0003F0E3BA|nr:PREDICTED: non-secretory ribonuclease [Elephantulus edwardii]